MENGKVVLAKQYDNRVYVITPAGKRPITAFCDVYSVHIMIPDDDDPTTTKAHSLTVYVDRHSILYRNEKVTSYIIPKELATVLGYATWRSFAGPISGTISYGNAVKAVEDIINTVRFRVVSVREKWHKYVYPLLKAAIDSGWNMDCLNRDVFSVVRLNDENGLAPVVEPVTTAGYSTKPHPVCQSRDIFTEIGKQVEYLGYAQRQAQLAVNNVNQTISTFNGAVNHLIELVQQAKLTSGGKRVGDISVEELKELLSLQSK